MRRKNIVYFSEMLTGSPSASRRQKPLGLATNFNLRLVQLVREKLPEELEGRLVEHLALFSSGTFGWIMQLFTPFRWLYLLRSLKKLNRVDAVAVGFNSRSLFLGWFAKHILKLPLIVFCWDPPGIQWRDRNRVSAMFRMRIIYFIFRITVKSCNLLVLSIHKNLLSEIKVNISIDRILLQPIGAMVTALADIASTVKFDPWLLGVQSVMTSEKNYYKIRDIVCLLLSENPKAKFIWVGSGTQNYQYDFLNEIKQFGIEQSRVEMTGQLPYKEAMRRLAEAGLLLYLYPNRCLRWNYPLKIPEYMALGRAVAAHDLPGVKIYLENGDQCGPLLPTDDPEAVKEILNFWIGQEDKLCNAGLQAARKSQEFEWEKLNEELADSINLILNKLS